MNVVDVTVLSLVMNFVSQITLSMRERNVLLKFTTLTESFGPKPIKVEEVSPNVQLSVKKLILYLLCATYNYVLPYARCYKWSVFSCTENFFKVC